MIDGVEGDLGTVAPENIEAIDVLKDASAAAIYGTRGANGVILITTKTGKREAHTTASYSGYVSASQFGKKLEFMTAEDVRAGKTNFTDKDMIPIGWMPSAGLVSLTIITLISRVEPSRLLILLTLPIVRKMV